MVKTLLIIDFISFNDNFGRDLIVILSTVEAGSSLGLWIGLSALGV